MTAPRRPSVADAVDRIEGVHRQDGRRFLTALGTVLRSLRLYPLENEQVQRAFDELEESARTLHRVDPILEMQLSGEFVFINRTRLRLALDEHAALGHVLNTFTQAGVGVLRVEETVARAEWQAFITLLGPDEDAAPDAESDAPAVQRLTDLQTALGEQDVPSITVSGPLETLHEVDAEKSARELARRTYQRSVAVTKQVVNDVRMGRTVNMRKLKRAVQGIVDQVLNNEVSLVGLTAIRDYDEYTFTHSVNVCIFAVAIGRRLGLRKRQLYDLGVAALLHDIGKSRVPLDLITKESALTDAEWRAMQSHPWLGVLALFNMQRAAELPYRGIVAAYEHHMKVDVTGYPRPVRRRNLSLFSKIVAVADGFDAATSRRTYQNPAQPDEVLREMWQNRRRGYDPVLVKELVNLVGIYPVGTCVILDSREVAVVLGRNPDSGLLHRPLVRLAISAHGEYLDDAPTVDLADQTGEGRFKRSIIKVTDPATFDINPGHVLL